MNSPEPDLITHLTARLQQPLPGPRTHARFSPRLPRHDPFSRDVPADARQAAALILLYPHAGVEAPAHAPSAPAVFPVSSGTPAPRLARSLGGDPNAPLRSFAYCLPLTVRRAELPDHAGQISLPGGRIDEGESAEAAALREAAEEIGVDPSAVRILGSLTPLYVLVSRFLVTPFVGVAETRPVFRPAEREVAELLEVPLHQLRDPSRLHWGHRTREGYLVDFPYFDLDIEFRAPHGRARHQVWGATAMILGEFVSLLDEGFGPELS